MLIDARFHFAAAVVQYRVADLLSLCRQRLNSDRVALQERLQSIDPLRVQDLHLLLKTYEGVLISRPLLDDSPHENKGPGARQRLLFLLFPRQNLRSSKLRSPSRVPFQHVASLHTSVQGSERITVAFCRKSFQGFMAGPSEPVSCASETLKQQNEGYA